MSIRIVCLYCKKVPPCEHHKESGPLFSDEIIEKLANLFAEYMTNDEVDLLAKKFLSLEQFEEYKQFGKIRK